MARLARLAKLGRFGAVAGAIGTLIFGGPAGADDSAAIGASLQYIGAFADLAGQPEVGDILTMAGMLVGATGEDTTGEALSHLSLQVGQLQIDLRKLAQQMNDLSGAQQVDAVHIAQTWNVGALQALGEKTDLLNQSVDEVLKPLGATPAAERDQAGPSGQSWDNRFHSAAFGVAQATMQEAGAFLDTGYLPYGGGCPATAGGPTDGLVGGCTPNQLWIIATVEPQKIQDRDAQGNLRSYGMIDGQNVIPAYRFRPEVGLATYFAELRVAIAAMQTDLEDADMMSPGGSARLSPRGRYFTAKYAHLFDRHIDFLTYYPMPDDPKPDGEGSSDYHRYVTHTNTSLSDSYAVALRRGEPGATPAVWREIDEMRDLLTYAEAHGTAKGWAYHAPAYIAAVAPDAPHKGVGAASSFGGRSAAAQAALGPPGPDDITANLVAADADGTARLIALKVDHGLGSLDASAPPFWREPGLSTLTSAGGASVIGVAPIDQMFEGVASPGAAFGPVGAGPGFALISPKGMFGGGDGVLYGIAANGDLLWTRISPAGVAAPARKVGNGWGGFPTVVSGGQGVIYAVTPTGDLLWYRHLGFLDGTVSWQGPITVGHGFSRYQRLVVAAGGVLVAIKADGGADYFHHRDYLTGVTDPGPTITIDGQPAGSGPGPGPSARRPHVSDFPQPPPGPTSHIAGPIPLPGVNLGAYPLVAGVLDVTQGSGRIK